MTREQWIERCQFRLVDEHGYNVQHARSQASDLADVQAEQDGDVEGWYPPEDAADDAAADLGD